jgi:hypothetical protein
MSIVTEFFTFSTRRILNDSEKESSVKISKDRIELSRTGMKILKLLEKGHFKVLANWHSLSS